MDPATQGTSAATFAKLFEFTYNVTKQNVGGFTHEDSLKQPHIAGNCLNWIVGHIVTTRSPLLKLLGQEAIWSEEESAPYDRGAPPLTDGARALPWEKILGCLDASQERLRQGLSRMTPEKLAAPIPDDQNPFGLDSVAEMIGAFNFHEAYHAGQTGILRRILGKEGAIN